MDVNHNDIKSIVNFIKSVFDKCGISKTKDFVQFILNSVNKNLCFTLSSNIIIFGCIQTIIIIKIIQNTLFKDIFLIFP